MAERANQPQIAHKLPTRKSAHKKISQEGAGECHHSPAPAVSTLNLAAYAGAPTGPPAQGRSASGCL